MPEGDERLVGRVSLPDKYLVPVAAVEDAAKEVATSSALGLALEQRHVDRHSAHHGQHRWQQPAEATQPELTEVDPAVAFVLADQQQRDQVAADDEEDLDPQETAAKPRVVGVVQHHGNDRQGTHSVEPRQIRNAVQLSFGRAERAGDAWFRPCAHRVSSIADRVLPKVVTLVFWCALVRSRVPGHSCPSRG